METVYLYDAFISYRHLPRDKEAAIRLQQLLESQKIPAAEAGHKSRKTLRIFRDQSELATGKDLGESIRQALAQSRYFILICSPKLQESDWCMEELRVFRQLHGGSNENILLLLTEGDAAVSVPDILQSDSGTDELLCADVRAKNSRNMKKRLKKEYLRLAAPILGCDYEAFHRQKLKMRRRRNAAMATSLLAAILGFAGYNMYMLKLISGKQADFYTSQSIRLSSMAETARDEGDYLLAMLLAKQALPPDSEASDRPLVPEAAAALRSAVLEREIMEAVMPLLHKAHISFNVTSWWICDTYAQGTKIAVTDFDNTYLYDAQNGALLFTCEGEEVYFNEQADRAVRFSRQGAETVNVVAEGYLIPTGEKYFSAEYTLSEEEFGLVDYKGIFDESTQDCYVIRSIYEEWVGLDYETAGSFDREGRALEVPNAPEEVMERFQDSYSYLNARFEDVFKAADYLPEAEETETAEIAEATEGLFLYNTEHIQGIQATEDGTLFIFNTYWMNNDYSLFWSRKENTYLTRLEGRAYLDHESGLIYVQSGTFLDIYAYQPENFKSTVLTPRYIEEPVRRLSADGKRLLDIEYPGIQPENYPYSHENAAAETDVSEDGWLWLRIRDIGMLSEPLIWEKIMALPTEGQYLYFVTPDIGEVLWQDPSRIFYLMETDTKAVRRFASARQENSRAVCLAMDQNASRLAAAWEYEGKGCQIEIFTSDTAGTDKVYNIEDTLIQTLDFSKYDTAAVTHMEFYGQELLVCTEQQSVLLDLTGNDEAKVFGHGNQGYNQEHFLTDDGLLFCTAYMDSPYCLEAVYDIHSGEKVFGNGSFIKAFQYYEETGTLAYQSTSIEAGGSRYLNIARRKRNGSFEDTCTIVSRGTDMTLRADGYSMDSQYVLLNGTGCCEAYDITTGKRAFSISDSGYALLEGELYDMETNAGGKLAVYSIAKPEELLQTAKRCLTSPYGTRELSEQETERYFIIQE